MTKIMSTSLSSLNVSIIPGYSVGGEGTMTVVDRDQHVALEFSHIPVTRFVIIQLVERLAQLRGQGTRTVQMNSATPRLFLESMPLLVWVVQNGATIQQVEDTNLVRIIMP